MNGVDVEERDQSEAVRGYISDMLAQLADLAAESGDRRLAASLRLIAVDAAREPPQAQAG